MTTTSTADTGPGDRSGSIDAAELRTRLDAVQVLDVRTAAEYETAHIPGAYHVPLDTLGEHCSDICSVDAEVVLVCQSGARADQAARKLAAAGMTSMRVLRNGMNGWQSVGGDVVRGRDRWNLERQVRLVAGAIVLAAILGSAVAPAAKWVAALVGGGLAFAALTDTCAMGNLLSRLPYNRAAATDVSSTVEALITNQPCPATE